MAQAVNKYEHLRTPMTLVRAVASVLPRAPLGPNPG
jgi:hypothetical protein